jgi:glutamine---fructose-6-phosphate transaminase (isomerizing)
MCGIVGYVGPRQCVDLIVGGLRKLEYRGYDSAGVAVVGASGLTVKRAKGKLQNLVTLLADAPLAGCTGIGHTRWATHGRPTDENAHPHAYGGVAVVHNGIIENHLELKAALTGRGHKFRSETDTEIFAHLVADALEAGARDLQAAIRATLAQVKGTYALAVISEKHPDEIVAAKNASPLVVGYGNGESFLASDVPAILEHTREVVYLEEGELAVLKPGGISLFGRDGEPLARKPRKIEWSAVAAEKDGHKHFMHKEIFEQPRAVADTIRGRASLEQGDVTLDGMEVPEAYAKGLERIVIVACGTSWHAGLSGRLMIEELARVPVEVELASEFRNRDPLVSEKVMCLAISQSGETADTLGAVKTARAKGAPIIGITNVVGSALSREATGTLYTHAGPEIGVASSKTFTSTLIALYLLALWLGRRRGMLLAEDGRKHIQGLLELPRLMERTLELEPAVADLAREVSRHKNFLFLGRGINYPLALEGALKLKELSYVHAEGYPAGEMKHGPIALLEDGFPVIALAPRDGSYDRMMSNLEEVRARDGRVIAIGHEGDRELAAKAAVMLAVPPSSDLLTPILLSIPLQLLAYHVAVRLGRDVDQPRNLAKSVTVE